MLLQQKGYKRELSSVWSDLPYSLAGAFKDFIRSKGRKLQSLKPLLWMKWIILGDEEGVEEDIRTLQLHVDRNVQRR